MVTKEQAKAVSDELEAVLNEILARHGLSESRVSVKYGEVFKMSLTATAVELNDEGVNTASPEALAYERYAAEYGLKEGLLGSSITLRGKTFTFVGLALKRSKYPYAFIGPTGKPMVFTADVVERLNATVS